LVSSYVFIILVLTFLLAELVSIFSFEVITGKKFEVENLKSARENKLSILKSKLEGFEQGKNLFSFHPYLGYSGTPGYFPWGVNSISYNSFGLLNQNGHKYPSKKTADSFIIGVLGGSVAEIFANQVEGFIQEYVDKIANFDRNIKIINLAVAGYKQPQQLIQLETAILNGFEFDAVINLDGFNDLALAVSNQNFGANPMYPSYQHFSEMTSLSSPPNAYKIKKLNLYYDNLSKEISILDFIQNSILSSSALINLIEEQAAFFIDKKSINLSAINGRNQLLFMGNSNVAGDISLSVKIWQESSVMTSLICKLNNIKYFHFLQPNQYVIGSKSLSSREKKIAYNPTHPWGLIIRENYHLLQNSIEVFNEHEVNFHDLTNAFIEYDDDIYVDDCCHFGLDGNRILSEKISSIIFTSNE